MWVHNLDPVLLSLGQIQIRWYGLMYVLGFLVTYFFCRKAIKDKRLGMTEDQLDALMSCLIIALVVGARLFEVLVYRFDYYAVHPWRVFAIWQGGLSFHGGFLAMLITAVWWARKHNISFWQLADVFIVPLSLGQAFGRLGNFINGELPGRLTDTWWAVKFPGVEGWRHPSSLYEALYDVIIFGVLFLLYKKRLVQGRLLALFCMLYAVFRFITEFFREPEIVLAGLTMGQWLNIPLFLLGILLWWLTGRITKFHTIVFPERTK